MTTHPALSSASATPAAIASPYALDAIDRAIVVATQGGLPLVAQPYHAIAEQLNIDAATVMARLRNLSAAGVIRRIGVVPNHYAIGYKANGMSVWDVPDDLTDLLGQQVGALDCVSHCYCRPRALPAWPYNLFAMVHGKSREEVETQVARIAALLGSHVRSHTILYSTRILKKTGLRLHRHAPPAGTGE